MTTTVGNIAIHVADLSRSEKFYVDTLGLTVRTRIEAPSAREVIVGASDGGGSALMLAFDKEGQRVPAPSGIWKIFIETDDVQALHQTAIAAGARSIMEPTRLEQFRVTISMIEDPDGYLVELGEIHPR